VPCPTCFLTRATALALHDDLGGAIELHAFGPLAAAALIGWSLGGWLPAGAAVALLGYWLLRLGLQLSRTVRFGIAASAFFPNPDHTPPVALPVVHCSADFLAPLVCGDALQIALTPRRLDPSSFEVHYSFRCRDREAARCPLPAAIQRWLEASALGTGVRPLLG
jgi:1,4-dihydroxy-2-naphthoyl-CoA hydrolase